MFEQLVSDLLARFVHVSSDEVDGAINESLRRIVECLNVDRSTLFQITPDHRDAVATHSYARPGIPPVPIGLRHRADYPWMWKRIVRGETICFSQLLKELAEVAPIDAENVRREEGDWPSKSLLLIPVLVAGQPECALSVAAVRSERDWPTELVTRLRLLAEVFACVLARRRDEVSRKAAEVERDELLRFERLVSDLSARFIQIGTDEVDRTIHESLRRIVECLDLDRGSLF
jgi:formate hydrogenlyase transcriptional activator